MGEWFTPRKFIHHTPMPGREATKRGVARIRLSCGAFFFYLRRCKIGRPLQNGCNLDRLRHADYKHMRGAATLLLPVDEREQGDRLPTDCCWARPVQYIHTYR